MHNKSAALMLAAALAVVPVCQPRAAMVLQTNRYASAAGETIGDELWLSAGAIDLQGEAQNDLFLVAAAQHPGGGDATDGAILLGGTCRNDVWALGNRISLAGDARDHVRLLAKTVVISGGVSNNAILAGNSVQIAPSARLGRGAWIVGENVVLEGDIEGDVSVWCKSVTISGRVGGTLRLAGNDIVVLPKARIGGDFIYTAPAEIALEKNVELGGQLRREIEPGAPTARKPFLAWPSIMTQAWLFLAAFGAGLALLFICPGFMDESAACVRGAFWKSVFTGFVAVAILPMVLLFLAVSIVGLPLAAMCFCLATIMIYTAKIAVALAVGTLILRRPGQGMKNVPALALGLALLYLLAGAGLAGVLVWFCIVCVGTGAMILAAAARRNR